MLHCHTNVNRQRVNELIGILNNDLLIKTIMYQLLPCTVFLTVRFTTLLTIMQKKIRDLCICISLCYHGYVIHSFIDNSESSINSHARSKCVWDYYIVSY